jgi:hypothetical protein
LQGDEKDKWEAAEDENSPDPRFQIASEPKGAWYLVLESHEAAEEAWQSRQNVAKSDPKLSLIQTEEELAYKLALGPFKSFDAALAKQKDWVERYPKVYLMQF